MKLNIVPSIIALAISALIAYGLYSWCRNADMQILLSIFGGVSMLLTFGSMLAISFKDSRTTVNVRVLSGVFAFLVILSNAIFCCISSFSTPLYVIINGLLLLTWFISAYGVARANKQ